jgi:hypothetical protein
MATYTIGAVRAIALLRQIIKDIFAIPESRMAIKRYLPSLGLPLQASAALKIIRHPGKRFC